MTEASRKRSGVSAALAPLGLLAAAVVACVVFAPVLRYGFVYDDHWTVEDNAALSSPLAPLLRAIATGAAAGRGIPDATRPTMVVSLWVDRHLFGAHPAGYHLHSLLLYALATLLAGLAVFAVTRRQAAAVAGALVFAVMPVHAEVVAAVNYREDLYAAIAVFSAVAWLFWPRRKPELVDHAVLVAALVLIGLFAKESTVVVAPVVLAVAAVRGRSRVRPWASLHRLSLGCTAFVLASFVAWRGWLSVRGHDDVPRVLEHRRAAERLFRAARYDARAALDALVPVRWSPDHAPEPAASPLWLVAIAVLVALVVVLARHRRTRALAAGFAVVLVAPLATSPLVAPINETADRYLLVATLGAAILWGDLFARARRSRPGGAPPWLWTALLLAAVVGLSVVCRHAAAPWRTDLSLWQTATERAPGSSRAWSGLARERRLLGDLDGADRAVEHAIELDPRYLRARLTRIYNRLARGDVGQARLDIEEIQRLGGGRQRGLAHARKCADLPPAAAARCIDGPTDRALPAASSD